MKLPLRGRPRAHSEKKVPSSNLTPVMRRNPPGPNDQRFTRPRSSTVGETFHKLLKQRRRSGGRTPRTKNSSPGSPADSMTGSLVALWQPTCLANTETMSIVVLGPSATGKSTLIERLVEAWNSFSNEATTFDLLERVITFRYGTSRRSLRFIEVNSDTDDLWGSLEGSGYLLLYAVNDDASFKCAENALSWLRTPGSAHADKPIWLVGTWADSLCRAVQANDAKSLSKKFGSQWFEVTSNPSELTTKKQCEQMLKLMKHIVVTFSTEDNISHINKLTLEDFPQLNQPLRKISRSCDNLRTLHHARF